MRSLKNFEPKKIAQTKRAQINVKDTLKQTPLQKAKLGMVYVMLILWTCVILVPVVGVLISSLNTNSQNYIDFNDFKFGFDNFQYLFREDKGIYFLDWLVNSLFVSVYTMLLTVAIVSLTGYAYSRFRFKGRRVSIMLIMLIQMVPAVSALIALYIINELLNQTIQILPLITLIIICLLYTSDAADECVNV